MSLNLPQILPIKYKTKTGKGWHGQKLLNLCVRMIGDEVVKVLSRWSQSDIKVAILNDNYCVDKLEANLVKIYEQLNISKL